MWTNLEALKQKHLKTFSKVFELEILFHATNELIINWNGFFVIFLSGDSQFGIIFYGVSVKLINITTIWII